MEAFEQNFWKMRLAACKQALEKNHFEVFIATDPSDARKIFLEKIFPEIDVVSASWGDSITLRDSGILEEMRNDPAIDLIQTFAPDLSREQSMERRRQALLVDLFFTGSNALTETGKLVNLDMVGNRVGGLTFGPKFVLLLIGRNKIVRDVEAAFDRIKSHAAPLNAIRHEGWRTPCIETSYCMDCNSPDRICNTWVITEKSYPPKRVKIILINQDCGL